MDRGIPTLPSRNKHSQGTQTGCKQKEEVRYTATLRVNRTLPVRARAQLKAFFSIVLAQVAQETKQKGGEPTMVQGMGRIPSAWG